MCVYTWVTDINVPGCADDVLSAEWESRDVDLLVVVVIVVAVVVSGFTVQKDKK